MIETDVTRMLGIKHPIIGAPMGPFYTTKLTIAISEAGGCGVLSHTNLFGKNPYKELKNNMLEVVEHTDKPFGFNVRVARMQPEANMLCRLIPKFIKDHPKVKEQCVYAITSAGSARMLQSSKSFKRLQEISSIKNFHVAPAPWLADKCVDAGVDGLVVTGTEGGGHQSYEKIGLIVLLQKIKQKYPDIPVVACGSVGNGIGLASCLAAGAGAVAMGTRFISSKDSEFHDKYKGIIPPAICSDTTLVTGVLAPIRLWKNNYTTTHDLVTSKEEKIAKEEAMTLDDLIEEQKHYEEIYYGHVEDGATPLGQCCGVIDSIETVKDIIDDVISVAEKYIKNAYSMIK
ncbi:MAG: NAD(P)H-dependent flavin oxidoreductase [Candidatus Hodarchaeota archaeon]